MFEGDSEESFSLGELHQRERARHQQLLTDIEDRLYAEDFVPQEEEELDERDSRYFYHQLDNSVDDKEIASWRRNFPYLRVVGLKAQLITKDQRPNPPALSVLVVKDLGEESYVLDAPDSEDTEDGEEVFAADGPTEWEPTGPTQLSPHLRDAWPSLVEVLRPFIRGVVRSEFGAPVSESGMSWGHEED